MNVRRVLNIDRHCCYQYKLFPSLYLTAAVLIDPPYLPPSSLPSPPPYLPPPPLSLLRYLMLQFVSLLDWKSSWVPSVLPQGSHRKISMFWIQVHTQVYVHCTHVCIHFDFRTVNTPLFLSASCPASPIHLTTSPKEDCIKESL